LITQTHHTNRRGFTIVELLIVIVVIAVLAAISIVSYNGIQERARKSEILSAADQMSKVVELYKIDNNSYPICSVGENTGCALSSMSSQLVPKYVNALPAYSGGIYNYVADGDSWGIGVFKDGKFVCRTGKIPVDSGWWASPATAKDCKDL
ncbi:MAG: prepilin-type N-terminal cleavage/methylation domain-containing protein, partial [Candidatus Saccharimonas sp.]